MPAATFDAGWRRLLPAAIAVLIGAGTSNALAQTSTVVDRSALRVCADPANMPFSNERRQGFENKIAALLGKKLDLPVVYTWFPQATGFVRRTLRAKKCDIIMGYAQGHELVLNTNHYYRSTYALIYKSASGLDGLEALDDPRLKSKKIGIIAGTPPATILAYNGLLTNVVPFNLMVDRRHESPAESMIKQLEKGEIDVAILWGPIGGYYANQSSTDFKVVPLGKPDKGPRMAFRITFGVRPTEIEWKRQLNDFIKENQSEINAILIDFGVPIIDENDNPIKG
jgi:quinoprotein dehydrogenase-associated probable ABC transporter substrate-binding protein